MLDTFRTLEKAPCHDFEIVLTIALYGWPFCFSCNPTYRVLLYSMIEVIKEAVEILCPFEEVTREVSSDKYISASKIIPLSKALQRLTVVSDGVCGALCDQLSTRMCHRFFNMEESLLLEQHS